MSKFRKKKKGTPGISTASLPDIVFMLLFFFMVTTVMRETELKIKKPQLPNATEVKKLERKSLVSYIYVGKVEGQGGDRVRHWTRTRPGTRIRVGPRGRTCRARACQGRA